MRFAATLVIFILFAQAAAAATWNVVKVGGRRYVPVSDVANFYRLNSAVSTGRQFKLTSAGRTIEGKAGTKEVLINGVKYILCFPLSVQKGVIYLSAMDVTKIIEPVMRPGRIKDAPRIKTVVLDAGHGGHDSGATGPLGKEKKFALDIALRARPMLTRAGFSVKMTRDRDEFIALEKRSSFANQYAGAVFVSIHLNKSKSAGGTGIETYALAPRGVPSMDEAHLSYSDFKQNPGNARDAENIALAAAVHSAMVKNLPLPDRGIKRARFAVIRNARIPAVLIEGGFMNNPHDSRLIANPEYRQRVANSIVEAVNAYAKSVDGSRSSTPTLIVSGAAPTSAPPIDTIEIGAEPASQPEKSEAAESVDRDGEADGMDQTEGMKQDEPKAAPEGETPASVETPKTKLEKWW